jgi:hypothetical protein
LSWVDFIGPIVREAWTLALQFRTSVIQPVGVIALALALLIKWHRMGWHEMRGHWIRHALESFIPAIGAVLLIFAYNVFVSVPNRIRSAAAAVKISVPLPDIPSALKTEHPRPPRVPPGERISDRHITPEQAERIERTLSKFNAFKLGLFTLSSSPERPAFTAEIEDTIRRTSWAVIRGKDITPGEANWMGLTIGPLRHAGVSIIAADKLNPESIVAAFEAARVPHRVIDIENMGGYIYRGAIDTSMLVIFIGPKKEPKPDE